MAKFTAIPKRIRLSIDCLSDDGETTETREFWGYVAGPGSPDPIVIEVDNINDEYDENYPTVENRNDMSDMRYLARARRANLLRYRDLLLAVIPGLQEVDANTLASPESDGLKILEELGYYKPAVFDPNDNTESESENKEEGEDETGKSQ